MATPPETLDRPGLYVSVSDRDGHLVHVARVSDPREIRAEGIETGTDVEVVFSASEGGVIAAKVPFAPKGTLRIFEVREEEVKRVMLHLPLRRRPFVKRGRSYRVPWS
jgi:hypothetical protein